MQRRYPRLVENVWVARLRDVLTDALNIATYGSRVHIHPLAE